MEQNLGARFPLDEGTGPAVVLLHPFPLDHRVWAPAVAQLRRSCRAMAIDLLGFGTKTELDILATDSAISMEAMADDVAAALLAAQVSPAAVVGVSMGGYVALALAQRFPELVPALVLSDTRARADNSVERERRARLIATLETGGRRANERLASLMLPILLRHSAPAELQAQVHDWIEAAAPANLIAALHGMALRLDRSQQLRDFPGRVLTVCGAEDTSPTSAEMQSLTVGLRAGTFVEIADAAHLPCLERPLAFCAAINRWLD